MTTFPLHIDIVSDVVCPWCIIGYKQLQQALAQYPNPLKVSIEWHPFELNPAMPDGGQEMQAHLAEKYGSTPAQSEAVRTRIKNLGDTLGFTFNYSKDLRIYNTFRAHQLLHWAKAFDKQTPLKLKLFTDYFTHQKAIDSIDTLVEAAEAVGLNQQAARDVLNNERYAASVRECESDWQNQGIYSVPTYLLNKKFLISGAQSSDVFTAYIDKLREKNITPEPS